MTQEQYYWFVRRPQTLRNYVAAGGCLAEKAKTFTITANASPDGSGSVIVEPTSVTKGGSATLTALPSSTLASFDHWSGDAEGTSNPLEINDIDSDKTVVANFTVEDPSKYEVKIGDKYYETFVEACLDAKDGDVLMLMKDISPQNEEIHIKNLDGEGFTIDLNGKTITTQQTNDVKFKEAKVTLKNGNIVVNGSESFRAVTSSVMVLEDSLTVTGNGSLGASTGCNVTVHCPMTSSVPGGTLKLSGPGATATVTSTIKNTNIDGVGLAVELYSGSGDPCTLNLDGGKLEGVVAFGVKMPAGEETKTVDHILNMRSGVVDGLLRSISSVDGTELDNSCKVYFNGQAVSPETTKPWVKLSTICKEGYAPKKITEGEYAGYYVIAEKL